MKFFRRNTPDSSTKEKPKSERSTPLGFGSRLKKLLGFGTSLDQESREQLEELLLLADTGIETTDFILQQLDNRIGKNQAPIDALTEVLIDILKPIESNITPHGDPWIVLVVGSNGVGKTTTIAKLAHYYSSQGHSPLLAAGDTFRAAAVEQLAQWAKALALPIVHQNPGADSASVIFDGIQSARAKKCDIVLADTAGRLHNKQQLLDELRKIKRVAGQAVTEAPHQTLLVVDASTGQNALSMAEAFHEEIGLTGIIMTKLDGSAKGGTLFSLAHKLSIPVPFIGTGEHMDDLQPLSATSYIKSLLQ